MKRVRAWLPAVLWMGVIFAMSAMPGDVSGGQSGRLTALLLRALERMTGGSAPDAEFLEFIVRKAAHMAEYAVLALLYLRALRREGARRPLALALLLCAAYACTDEGHQAFVDGRGPSVRDVMIDTAGAALSLAVWAAARRVRALAGRQLDRRAFFL